ncbi:MAG: hypothetical protein ACPF8V_06105, partial [Luteibaculum sp.]
MNKLAYFFTLLFLFLGATHLFAQNTEAFSVLNTAVSAREAGLGGKIVAADFTDAQLQSYHPQLI